MTSEISSGLNWPFKLHKEEVELTEALDNKDLNIRLLYAYLYTYLEYWNRKKEYFTFYHVQYIH